MANFSVEIESFEWKEMLEKLRKTATKTNKDKLCVKCWQVYSYKLAKRHQEDKPAHSLSLLSPSAFSSENTFLRLAYEQGRCELNNSGRIFRVMDPFDDQVKLKNHKFMEWKKKRDAEKLLQHKMRAESTEERSEN